MNADSPNIADAFGYGHVRLRRQQELLKNAERSTMLELMDRAHEAAMFDESVRRRNAMLRVFLARWSAIEALRAIKDPPKPPPIQFNRIVGADRRAWRGRAQA